MKILHLILFFIISIKFFSQEIPLNLASTKNFKKATLFLKDGSKKEGFVDFNYLVNHKIKFKKTLSDKKEKYDSRKVKKLYFNLDSTSYFYRKIGSTRNFVLLKLINETEKISLFTALNKKEDSQSLPFSISGNGIGIKIFDSKPKFYETIFFAKNIDDKAFYFNNNTQSLSFKKSINRYFSDCKELVEKVNNNEFKKEDIISVIKFYNDCN